MTNSPLDQSIEAAVQAWVMSMLGLDILHVIPAHDNRVPPPGTPFVMVSHLLRRQYETAGSTYDGVSTETVSMGLDYSFQIDSYGVNAADWAMIMQVLFKSGPTAAFFEAWGQSNSFTIDPMFCDDATHMPIVNEEEQYEERWTLKPHFCVLLSVATPQQFMTEFNVNLINVQATYHQ